MDQEHIKQLEEKHARLYSELVAASEAAEARALHICHTQAPVSRAAEACGATPYPVAPELPDVGSQWAIRKNDDTGTWIGTVKAADRNGIFVDSKDFRGLYGLPEWDAKLKSRIPTKADKKAARRMRRAVDRCNPIRGATRYIGCDSFGPKRPSLLWRATKGLLKTSSIYVTGVVTAPLAWMAGKTLVATVAGLAAKYLTQ